MASYADTTSSGTIYRAKENYDHPHVDLLTLLFDDVVPNTHLTPFDDTILHADAADPSQHLTKKLAKTLTRRTAHLLRHTFGIGRNGPGKDIVTVISTGHYLVPLCFYSTVAADGIFSAASAASNVKDLARTLTLSSSNLLICNEATREVAVQAAAEASLPADRVLLMSETAPWSLHRVTTPSTELLSEKELAWRTITNPTELENQVIAMIFSSGTTGLPKGVCLSHTNIVAEAYLVQVSFRSRITTINPTYRMRTLAHLPVAHIAGLQGYMVNPFFLGGTVYWMPRFSFPEFLAYNKRHKITMFFTVPPIYLLIAKSPEVTDQFDTLEFAISGAAPLGKELQYAASQKLGQGKCFISQTWGLSESCGSATYLPVGMRDDTGSVSGLVPSVTARIIDDDGNDVPVGSPGEILLKGPVLTKGYFRNDRANAESFRDGGWYCTGDIGLFKNGFFYIVDRKKELIKYKGLQVAPAELEALLLTHPLILDCAVIGVPIENNTNEAPRAFVVVASPAPAPLTASTAAVTALKPPASSSSPPDSLTSSLSSSAPSTSTSSVDSVDSSPDSSSSPYASSAKLTASTLQAWIKQRVANHKQLRGGVEFVPEIPKSPSGKILRKELREMVRRRAEGARL